MFVSKMNIIFISEISPSKPRVGPNKILNEVLIRKQVIGIYSQAWPTITYFLIYLFFLFTF